MSLKICPLCGGSAREFRIDSSVAIECSNPRCFCRTQFDSSYGRVSDAWNKHARAKGRGFLAACPCCGNPAVEMATKDSARWYFVECPNCLFRTLASPTRDESIKKWGKRYGG